MFAGLQQPDHPFFRDILAVPVSLELEEAVAELLAEFPHRPLGSVCGAILWAARTAGCDESRDALLERARVRLRD